MAKMTHCNHLMGAHHSLHGHNKWAFVDLFQRWFFHEYVPWVA